MNYSDVYTAGFVDGEGCIGVYACNGYTYAKVEVTQTDKSILDWLKQEYGGVVNVGRRKKINPNASPIWRWTLQGKRCVVFFNKITPYIRVKNKELEHALKFLIARYGNEG